ncbi:MAG: PAS domain S-box protein [Methanomicrobiaceae archaeon]|nr:PAS domain S-box protein [Methanomicrobiaceae archaeon]
MIRVLLVDDEPMFLTASRIFLEKDPEIRCETAGSASEALMRMEEGEFDAIVSDYDMPGMEGIAFLRRVRATIPNMPFILLTGRGREEVVIEALNSGVDFYLQKGFEPRILYAELRHKIRRAVERKRTADALRESEEKFRTLFTSMNEAFSLCEILCDEEGRPGDIRILEANPAWEKETGLSRDQYLDRRFQEVLPGIEPYWIERYGRVALTGEPAHFEDYNHNTGRFYDVFAFSPSPGRFATFLHNTTERKQAEHELLALKGQLETEIEDLNTLRSLSLRYITGDDFRALLQEILEAAIALTGADKGTLQLLDPATGMLTVVAQKHFDPPFLEFFARVGPEDAAACGAALERGERVVVEDIANSPVFDPGSAEMLREEGIRAVQSTPLVSREGRMLGILSTHFREIHAHAERELRLVDILARQAADMIARTMAEEALRKSEERLQLAQKAGNVGVFDWNLETNETILSSEMQALFGFPPGPFTFRDWARLVLSEDFERVTTFFQEWFQSGRLEDSWEYRFVRSDGSLRWMEAKGTILRGPEGQPLRMIGTNLDITDHKLAEHALKESEERYRTLLESTADSVYVLDHEFRNVLVNEAATRFVQMPKERLLGNKLTDLFPGIEETAFFKVFRRVMETRQAETVEAEFVFPGGRRGWYEVQVDPVPEGILCISRDITARKQAEEDLRESKEKYRQFFEQDLTGDFITTEDGWILTCNPTFVEIFGFGSLDEALHTNIVETYPSPEDRNAFMDLLKRERNLTNLRRTRTRRDGSPITVVENVVGRFDAHGNLIDILSYLYDDSERNAAEEALKEANTKLNLLTSITRHDILNQVTALKAFHILIEEQAHSNPEVQEMVAQVQCIADTIRRQITFTGDYQHMGEKDPEWQHVAWVVARAAESVRINGTRLAVDTGSLEVFADPMLEKVFYNLLDNAMAHGNGVTEISVRFCDHADGGTLVIEDDGTGVPAAMKEEIFEKGVGTITGYGLFLAREILGITGMAIRETGEEGEGARFEIAIQGDRWRVSGADT